MSTKPKKPKRRIYVCGTCGRMMFLEPRRVAAASYCNAVEMVTWMNEPIRCPGVLRPFNSPTEGSA